MTTIPTDFDTSDNLAGSECEYVMTRACERPWDFYGLAVSLYLTLSQWSQNPIPVVVHRLHRRHLDQQSFEGVVGCLAGDFPLQLSVAAGKERELLTEFKTIFKDVPAAALSYEILALSGERPFPWEVSQVRLNYQPELPLPIDDSLRVTTVQTSLYQLETSKRYYQLDLIVRPKRTEITVVVRYSRDAHRLETIERFVSDWLNRAESMTL